MARHAATGTGTEYRPVRKEGARSHRKVIHVSNTNTTLAVVRNDEETVIAEKFVNAVKVIYIGGKIATAAEGSPTRIVELIATQMRGRRGMPRWTNEDVETALDYLATEGQITLPELALAAS
jgi:hypothetical protein